MPVSFFIENPPNTWSIIRVYCTGTLMYRYSNFSFVRNNKRNV